MSGSNDWIQLSSVNIFDKIVTTIWKQNEKDKLIPPYVTCHVTVCVMECGFHFIE